MKIIATVEIRRVYSKKMRMGFIKWAVVHVWLSKKAKTALAYARAKEHAYWLVGAGHPAQAMN